MNIEDWKRWLGPVTFIAMMAMRCAAAEDAFEEDAQSGGVPEGIASQSPNWRLERMDLDETSAAALNREIERLKGLSGPDVYVFVEHRTIRRVLSPALETLFPEYVFARVPFDLREYAHAKSRSSGASGLSITVAIHRKSGRTFVFPGAHHKSFGDLLAAEGVKLTSNADAERIWAAFCAAHQKDWFHGEHRMLDSRTWKLNSNIRKETSGKSKIQREYFYEIVTESDGTVATGRLRNVPPWTRSGAANIYMWTKLGKLKSGRHSRLCLILLRTLRASSLVGILVGSPFNGAS